jgi:hypothetical protein
MVAVLGAGILAIGWALHLQSAPRVSATDATEIVQSEDVESKASLSRAAEPSSPRSEPQDERSTTKQIERAPIRLAADEDAEGPARTLGSKTAAAEPVVRQRPPAKAQSRRGKLKNPFQ